MNRKNWDDDTILEGEIIHCNVCDCDESVVMGNEDWFTGQHQHVCFNCGWDIFQTDDAVELVRTNPHLGGNILRYSHKGCHSLGIKVMK